MLHTIVVLADIHGNSDALTAVLEDIGRHKPDTIVVLGDHLSGPLAAAETADQLMDLSVVAIRGNHDRQLLEILPENMGPSDFSAHLQLKPHHLRWLSCLPVTFSLMDEVFLCHGTPGKDDEYLLQTVGPSGAMEDRSLSAVETLVSEVRENVILCAHTHKPAMLRLSDGRLVVNPGSVGLQAYSDDDPVAHISQTGAPAASYAVLRKSGGGWEASFHRVSYDFTRMSAMARDRKRPDWAMALETGTLE